MVNFSDKLSKIAKNTDLYLKRVFSKQSRNSYLIRPMKYGLLSGGKKLRSSIVVTTGKIFNTDYKKLIIIGAAVECIHSYSLIHDDLPSMDNDNFRRGKPSTHKKFNEFTAILAGNSLLTLAFEILSGKDLNISQNFKNQLIRTLSMCSGHLGLAGGQYFDLTFENKNILKKNIINMQRKKTGELFGFCCESVGIINGVSHAKRKELKEIGIKIGLLFQIIDEIPDPKKISEFKIQNKYGCFMQKNFQSKLNLLNITDKYWMGTKICQKKYLKSPQWLRNIKTKKRPFWKFYKPKEPQIIFDGGWHFSFLKSPKDISKKITSYSHSEFNKPEFTDEKKIEERIKNRTDIFDRNYEYEKISLDSSFPKYLLDNINKFENWIIH